VNYSVTPGLHRGSGDTLTGIITGFYGAGIRYVRSDPNATAATVRQSMSVEWPATSLLQKLRYEDHEGVGY